MMDHNEIPSLPEDEEGFSPAREAEEDELGAEMGDPRRCPRHPHVVTSSPDGMFDCPCDECEYEMSAEYAERQGAGERYVPASPPVQPLEDDEIPF